MLLAGQRLSAVARDHSKHAARNRGTRCAEHRVKNSGSAVSRRGRHRGERSPSTSRRTSRRRGDARRWWSTGRITQGCRAAARSPWRAEQDPSCAIHRAPGPVGGVHADPASAAGVLSRAAGTAARESHARLPVRPRTVRGGTGGARGARSTLAEASAVLDRLPPAMNSWKTGKRLRTWIAEARGQAGNAASVAAHRPWDTSCCASHRSPPCRWPWPRPRSPRLTRRK